MTEQPKYRTVTLTGRPPVRIREDAWPIVGRGDWDHHDGVVECQANRTWEARIRVRQHADGRALVYGVYEYSTDWRHEPNIRAACGTLLEAGGDEAGGDIVSAACGAGGDIPAAIRAVAAELAERGLDASRARDLADECVASLPAVTLE